MSKVFTSTKLILFLSLISICLSFGVITHQFNKNPLNSQDKRFNNAISLFTKKVVEKKGGGRNTRVVPVAAFRNFDNGISYKILVAVAELKLGTVEFIEADFFSPYTNSDNETELFVHSGESYSVDPEFHEIQPGKLWNTITKFLRKKLIAKRIYIKKVYSVLCTLQQAQNSSYFVVSMDVESEGKTNEKIIVVSLEDDKDFEVINSFDFPLKIKNM